MLNWYQCPASGRRVPLLRTLELLHERTGGAPAHIVEVGTIRSDKRSALKAGGWATRIFGWYAAQVGGNVTTIDPDRAALAISRRVCSEWAGRISWVHGRGEDVVGRLDGIDLLYLDGPNDPRVHADVFRALADQPPLILVDDILDCRTFDVKGSEVIPLALSEGYGLEWCGDRQALLSLPKEDE